VSARWLERLLATKRCGGAGRFGSVRLATDCLPDGGLAAQARAPGPARAVPAPPAATRAAPEASRRRLSRARAGACPLRPRGRRPGALLRPAATHDMPARNERPCHVRCSSRGGARAQLAHARVHLDALAPERCLPALLSGAYGRLAALEVTGVEHWPGRGGSTALLAALRPAALPALAALTLRGAPEFALLPAGARPAARPPAWPLTRPPASVCMAGPQ